MNTVAIAWLCHCILLHLRSLLLLKSQDQALGDHCQVSHKGLGSGTARPYASPWQTMCGKGCSLEFEAERHHYLRLQEQPVPMKSNLEEALGQLH